VDQCKERLEWGRPDLDLLRLFCLEHFSWNRVRTDELLLPVLKLWDKHDHQSRIDSFFTAAATQGGGAGFNERFAKYRSERIRNAVAGLTGKALDPELAIEATAKELKGAAAADGKGKDKGGDGRSRPKKRRAPVDRGGARAGAGGGGDDVTDGNTGMIDGDVMTIDEGVHIRGKEMQPLGGGAAGPTTNRKRGKRGGGGRGSTGETAK
jgi:DNA excision repair protein ERCC-5